MSETQITKEDLIKKYHDAKHIPDLVKELGFGSITKFYAFLKQNNIPTKRGYNKVRLRIVERY